MSGNIYIFDDMKMSSSPLWRKWGHVHPDTWHVSARSCHQKLAGLNFSPPCDFKSPEDISLANTFHDIEENSDKIEINCLIYLTFVGLHLRKFECVPTSTNMFHVLMLIIDKLNVLSYSYFHFVTWLLSGKWNNSIMYIQSQEQELTSILLILNINSVFIIGGFHRI